jgi:hypothetical protein
LKKQRILMDKVRFLFEGEPVSFALIPVPFRDAAKRLIHLLSRDFTRIPNPQ